MRPNQNLKAIIHWFLFSFIKQLKKSPEQLGKEIGDHLVNNNPDLFTAYNVIKGFLNLTVKNNYWIEFLQKNYADRKFWKEEKYWQKSNGGIFFSQYK